MTRPGFAGGVVVAIVLAAGAAALATALGPVLGVRDSLRGVILATGFAYLCYLLTLARWRAGALTSLLGWTVASLVAAWALPSTAALFLVVAGLLWLVRSLFFHYGVLSVAADFLLTAFAAALAVAAVERTGSLAMAAWSFFLVQAAFCVIPANSRAGRRPDSTGDFDRAARRAAVAARALKTRSP